jgi:hypothetical protein
MADYYRYDENSMPPFLDVVRRCLAALRFTLKIDNKLVTDCLSETLAEAKESIDEKTV